MTRHPKNLFKVIVALLIPFCSCGLQWLLWDVFKPFVWFLFFPSVFFSSRIGGRNVGIAATVCSALMVWYFFIPPQLSFLITSPRNLYSVAMFLIMGVLFSLTHDSLEKAKRRAAEALEESRLANERLQESNEQVTRLYEKTLKLDELKTRFFANVSHELRTPLTLILGPVGRRLADPELRDQDRDDLMVVERNARMLYRQVTDLLDVAKLEAGKTALRYANIDLPRLVGFVVSFFEVRAAEKDISFSVETPKALTVPADPEKCRRVLLNLLANAFKFTQNGGKIAVILREDNGFARIDVQDNGPGIPADKRDMIFERFSQIDGGADRKFGGTGLGLAIVREFVELHGGSIRVTDAPGGGALFSVALPLTAPHTVVIESGEEECDDQFEKLLPDGELHRRRIADSMAAEDVPLILVVEDNPDMNSYLASLLTRQYRVATAFNGEEGVARAQALQPDLLICDVMMPLMNGERMVNELRRQNEFADLPIIMLTAKADDNLRVRLLENGVQEYLTKPFSDAELMARVNGLLADRKRTKGELQKSEECFRQLFAKAPIPLCLITSNGALAASNERFVRLFGYDRQEMPTLSEWWRLAYPDETYRAWAMASWETAVTNAEAAGVDVEPGEYNVTCKDGTTRTMLISGISLGDDFLTIFYDITARRQAEEEIRHLNADLEKRVESRTAELVASNRELDAFAYAVSHDLRAPLRAMNGFSQALVEDFGAQLPGEAHQYLQQIMLAGANMGRLIDGLLSLSRSTRCAMQCELLNLSTTAELIRGELARLEPDRAVTWQIEQDLAVRGDPRMLEAVMRNLLGNAWKYTAGTPAPLIRVYSEERDGTRFYCVADNGAGFDMRHAERLFKPFQRLHRQDEFPGIGIGLATVQRIIHRHGGTIEAEAALGTGATFRFSLSAA